MSRQRLTPRQQAILDFIIDSIQMHGFPPTLREIGDAFGIRSTKGVNDHLAALQRKGWIRRHPDVSRGIELVAPHDNESETTRLPLLGRIAAGAPLLAEENIEDRFVVDRSLARGGEFMLCVQGDSMVNAHICDGDYIVVRSQSTAEDGEIVAALVDDEATVKRFFREPDGIRLQPENDRLQPIRIRDGEGDVRILGKVVGVFRPM